jgi:hypothetical protein
VEGLLAVSVFDALVVPFTTLPKESAPGLSCSVGCFASGDDAASSSDDCCASTGCANTVNKNSIEKMRPTSARADNFNRNMVNFSLEQ